MLNKLVDGQSSIVRLDNGVGNLRRWDDRKGGHHTVGKFFTDLRNQEGTHTGAGTASERVGDLEALEAVTGLRFAADDIDDLIYQLSTLGVVALGPVVTSTRLAKDEVVWAEKLAKGTSLDGIHGAGLEINEDGAGNIFICVGLKAS